MAKFPPKPLPRNQEERLLLELCQALASLRGPQEAAQLLTDLLGPQELTMVAKRLSIARLLIGGATYEQIRKRVLASPVTVARVNLWLQRAGQGYRKVVARTKRSASASVGVQRSVGGTERFMRRFPLSFWPETLLLEIIRGASDRQRRQLQQTLATLSQSQRKPVLYRQLDELLRQRR